MIVSVNPRPQPIEFQKLMNDTDRLLNEDAQKRPSYYITRGGNPLEDDVISALEEAAKGTAFQNTIEKVSGQRFPDIIVAKCYGVEVKSTKGNHWTSTGSSILETTRVDNVERLYMTFGKLGGHPIEFRSKPYAQCLQGIAVTHMPRYLIDMALPDGQTIFDKMGVPYEELRKMDKPVIPVAKYYRSKLKPGESLWWTSDSAEETVPAVARLWRSIPTAEKRKYTIYGYVNYPEIFCGDYDKYALWLVTQGIVDTHIRDQFSAGGKEAMLLSSGEMVMFPAVYRRLKENLNLFISRISQKDPSLFLGSEMIDKDELPEKLEAWASKASRYSAVDYGLSMDALRTLFALR